MDNFYNDLPSLGNFSDIANLDNYVVIPDDWQVVIADVKGSTKAIKAGEYKAVNIIGVSVITSILNAIKPENIPYIFGGDGATLCIPDSLVPDVKDALLSTQQMAENQFSLGLRIGIVPMTAIRQAQHDLRVCKHMVSDHYVQAAFAGDGIDYAESLIKNDDDASEFLIISDKELIDADYSGLECRWDNIPSKHGETISLIVKVKAASIQEETEKYKEIISKITAVYGDETQSRPLYESAMKTTLDSSKLKYEHLARTGEMSIAGKLWYWLFMRIQVFIGKFVMKYNLKTGGIDWSKYRTDAVQNADYRKFDGVLREILSGTAIQRKELETYLHDLHKNGDCFYGIHVSSSALVTCLINNRVGDHFHFVDGNDGGYAMAAANMKEQIKFSVETTQ